MRYRNLTSQFCIFSGSSGHSGLCKKSSDIELPLKSEDLLPYVKAELVTTDHIAIMWFCSVLFQFHYIQQKFYKEIHFVLLNVFASKHFCFGRILPFPGRKKK